MNPALTVVEWYPHARWCGQWNLEVDGLEQATQLLQAVRPLCVKSEHNRKLLPSIDHWSHGTVREFAIQHKEAAQNGYSKEDEKDGTNDGPKIKLALFARLVGAPPSPPV